MGLDMYVFTTATKLPAAEFRQPEDAKLLHDWRKHDRLHAWMERLYRDIGGMEEFNLVGIVLDAEALARLADDIAQERLPKPSLGYNFDRRIDDLSFIAKALAALARGLTIYYVPSW